MKQEISPKVFITVIAAIAIIAVGVIVWVWRAPTVAGASSSTHSSAFASPTHSPSETRAMAQEMRQEMLSRRQHLGTGNAQGGQANPNASQ